VTVKPPKTLRAANDNQPKARRKAPKVSEAWPEDLPITCEELDLLELYLGDIILEEAANDNEPA